MRIRIRDLINPRSGIKDGKSRILHPGSGIIIPDPQHWKYDMLNFYIPSMSRIWSAMSSFTIFTVGMGAKFVTSCINTTIVHGMDFLLF
jgi:hypothetical protein